MSQLPKDKDNRFSRQRLERVLRRATLAQLRWLLDALQIELTSRTQLAPSSRAPCAHQRAA